MKLKLDLHPIFNDSHKIEVALQDIIEEAIAKRATEVEIIPGKGSGALKKSVLRFLDRPEIKARYHRMEKDGDNWGRLFVHFRQERPEAIARAKTVATMVSAPCGCCGDPITVPTPEAVTQTSKVVCAWCGSPNRLTFGRNRADLVHAFAELDYSES